VVIEAGAVGERSIVDGRVDAHVSVRVGKTDVPAAHRVVRGHLS